MADDTTYDLAVIGGGLAGLGLSIQIARLGYKVILFEKEKYPFHRVCGEYVSLESREFLQNLGLDLEGLSVSSIKRLYVSDSRGNSFEQQLPLGGFGISRYKLDETLSKIAMKAGVCLRDLTRVDNVHFENDIFSIESNSGVFKARLAAGSFGKRSNLDIKWNRPFSSEKKNKSRNYIGVKYHVRCNYPEDTIALFNFKKGYCGLVKIENDQYCFCYLTIASNLKNYGNDIRKMETTLLASNPQLKKILDNCERIREEPVIISQISFEKKSLLENHILMIGDSAGMITPLCGNGMSMALHASKIAADNMLNFLNGNISRSTMEKNYEITWKNLFAARLRTGRLLQRLFDNQWLMNGMVSIGRIFPRITRLLIKKTHGQTF